MMHRGWNVSSKEARRAELILLLLKGSSLNAAMAKTHTSKRLLGRLVKAWEERGTYLDAPHSGRPKKHNESTMARAVELISDCSGVQYTIPKLVNKMKEEGDLDHMADKQAFTRSLHEHVKAMGHTLQTKSTETTFFLTNSDHSVRVDYSNDMLQRILKGQLDNMIFIDETQLSEGPHPKGVLQCMINLSF
jgi:transposase